MIFFPEINKFSGNNIDSSFQKCPLGKKCNFNENFSRKKGRFAPGKRALAKTWGGGWPPWPPRAPPPRPPPGSYAPVSNSKLFDINPLKAV
jgi:hypothetical protein